MQLARKMEAAFRAAGLMLQCIKVPWQLGTVPLTGLEVVMLVRRKIFEVPLHCAMT